jgi:hypothetical protein
MAPKPPAYVQSARVRDPWKTVNRRTASGRALVAMVDDWRAQLGGDPADVKLTADLIALGQLYLKCEQARTDPRCSPASTAWCENAYFRRLRQLGLSRHHRYSQASPLVRR